MARPVLMPTRMRDLLCLLLAAASMTACVANGDDAVDEINPTSGKADGDTTLTLEQGHHPLELALACEFADTAKAHDCDITFTLAPTAYTKKLMGKKLTGKTASDLPLPVLHQNLQGDPFGTVDIVADLRPDDGTGAPIVATLADGTPVIFHGAELHVAQRAQTRSLLRLQMEVAFWYNEVDFEYTATFADAGGAQTQR